MADLFEIAVASKLSGSGGGGAPELFRINGIEDQDTGDRSFDKTFAEVKDAWLNGMLPYFTMRYGTDENEPMYYGSLYEVQFVSGEPSAFAFILLGGGATIVISE